MSRSLSCLLSVVLVVAASSGCGSASIAEQQAAAAPAVLASVSQDPGSAYCRALDAMFEAQPDGSFDDEQFAVQMRAYAASVEAVAALSDPAEALIMFELAAVAELVASEPGNARQAERLASMVGPVGVITGPAAGSCGLEPAG